MTLGRPDFARPDIPSEPDSCRHVNVAPRGASAAHLSFPVLSAELEFGACQDCHSSVLRELGEAHWEYIPREWLLG
jgi:hypothetical protein